MRSRFTAFARGDTGHLLRSWHRSMRPRSLDLDPDTRWTRLDVLAIEGGGPFGSDGVVLFEAHYRDAQGRGSVRERSRFVREARTWFYVDGDRFET